MSEMVTSGSSISPRHGVALTLAAGLSIAAAIAIIAILTHSFDRTDAQLIGTSLGSPSSQRSAPRARPPAGN